MSGCACVCVCVGRVCCGCAHVMHIELLIHMQRYDVWTHGLSCMDTFKLSIVVRLGTQNRIYLIHAHGHVRISKEAIHTHTNTK
jgi:hypothetical protein